MSKKDALKIFHIDMNFVSLGENYLRCWLKRISEMGYNAILWELENKIQWETCPECVWPEAMSKKDFKKLLKYASSLGLEAIPLFQTIGHGEYVMIHKEYKSFRENPERHDCYCTSKPEVRKFLKKWIDEYLELFGKIRYFHLGGDEAYEFGKCPICKKYCDKYGKNKLYTDHIVDISQNILKKGAKPGIWADMVLNHPEEMNAIPENFVMWDWNYWGSDVSNETVLLWGKGLKTKKELDQKILKLIPELKKSDGSLNPFYTSEFLKRLGYEVILCSSSRSAGDSNFCGRHKIHSENIIGCARQAAKHNLLGTCLTSWAIRLHPYEIQEQWLALAPYVMDNPQKDYKAIILETAKKIFGTDAESFIKAIELIGEAFPFSTSMEVGIQWNHLKDSQTAPSNYIKEYIKKRKSDAPAEWKKVHARLEAAEKNIREGLALLNEFEAKNPRRKDILMNWQFAAFQQLNQVQIAKAAVDKAGGKKIDTVAVLRILKHLKALYLAHNTEHQTPLSAMANAALLYDALTEYMSSEN